MKDATKLFFDQEWMNGRHIYPRPNINVSPEGIYNLPWNLNHKRGQFGWLAQVRYLFDEVDCGLQIESKIDELPLDAFALIFLLLQNKHGVVEELLKLLVCVVNAELFEAANKRGKTNNSRIPPP